MFKPTLISFLLLIALTTSARALELYLPYKYPGSIGYIKTEAPAQLKAILQYANTKWKFESPKIANELLFAIPYRVKGNFTVKVYKNGKLLISREFPIWKKKYRVSKIWVKQKPLTKQLLKRILREQKLLKKILRTVTFKKFKEKQLIPPLKKLSISTPFGAKRIINGKKHAIHWGTDFRAPKGTPVFASLTGKVVLARNLFFTGNTVIIDHGLGLHTLYAHLSKISVKEGQMVKGGEKIGEVGSTGRSTGPHLHFGVYIQGVRVDPMIALKEKLPK